MDDRAITVGSSSIDSGPDLSPVWGDHEVQGVGLHVAGHRSPVRIDVVDGGGVTDESVATVRALLIDRL